MSVTAIEGIVQNGAIRLREDVSLPENTRVYVIVPEMQTNPRPQLHSPRLAHPEQSKDFRKQILEISDDAGL